MYKMKNKAPVRKVAASSLAAALTTLMVWGIGLVLPETVLPDGVPSEIQGALLTVVVFIVGYYTPPSETDVIEPVNPDDRTVAG